MAAGYLHNRKDFESLIRTLSAEMGVLEFLVEKDYWIMHVLHSLKEQGLSFELKGGTSLSKGFGIIDRFSEDIDMHISPPDAFVKETGIKVNENPRSATKNQVDNRFVFFDWLAEHIQIDGIVEVVRDHEFDDKNGRNGGIRLKYESYFEQVEGIKEGILLEAGFAKITPNQLVDISSWMHDKAADAKLRVTDNRAAGIVCYHPGYTLVEKLQTIATKFRMEKADGDGLTKVIFMRQYYDVFQLLHQPRILEFIGSDEYFKHKEYWFPELDLAVPLAENEAFSPEGEILEGFKARYNSTAGLYYHGQPDFHEILVYIKKHLDKL